MRLLEGCLYKTRNGRIVGPMINDGGSQPDHWHTKSIKGSWHSDGSYCTVPFGNNDLDLVKVFKI